MRKTALPFWQGGFSMDPQPQMPDFADILPSEQLESEKCVPKPDIRLYFLVLHFVFAQRLLGADQNIRKDLCFRGIAVSHDF